MTPKLHFASEINTDVKESKIVAIDYRDDEAQRIQSMLPQINERLCEQIQSSFGSDEIGKQIEKLS
jgi:hypothetical protein